MQKFFFLLQISLSESISYDHLYMFLCSVLHVKCCRKRKWIGCRKGNLLQSSTFCTDSKADGQMPFLKMLILSAKALVVPCAQHEPQYWGMCWFLV